jgi:hypothetical protein
MRASSASIRSSPKMLRWSVSCAACTRPARRRSSGSRQARVNHTKRMPQLEQQYASRFPDRTRTDSRRARKNSRARAGQPLGL